MPTNDDVHRQLESDVAAYATKRGYIVQSITYHEAMSVEAIRRLQCIDTVAALDVRNHADRTLIHQSLPSVFLYEAKGRQSRWVEGRSGGQWNGRDGLFEASQFVHNRARCVSGARILYCFRNPQLELDVGFWCSDLHRSAIKLIHWPPRWRGTDLELLLLKWFPDASHMSVQTNRATSSGDPYIVVPYEFLGQCKPWKSLIDDEMAKVTGAKMKTVDDQSAKHNGRGFTPEEKGWLDAYGEVK